MKLEGFHYFFGVEKGIIEKFNSSKRVHLGKKHDPSFKRRVRMK